MYVRQSTAAAQTKDTHVLPTYGWDWVRFLDVGDRDWTAK